MNVLRMITRFRGARISRILIIVSTLMLTGWFQAQLAQAALHEDGSNLHHALAVADDPALRSGLATGLDSIMKIVGTPEQAQQLGAVLQSTPSLDGPVSEALISGILQARDELAVQLELPEGVEYHDVSIPMVPILNAFGIPVTQEQIDEVGFGQLVQYPVLTAKSMGQVAKFYDWLQFAGSWGLLIGAVTGIAGIALSPRPLRTLGAFAAIVAVVAFTAPLLFSWLRSLISAGKLGAVGVLVDPLSVAAENASRPWLLPIGIVAGLAAAGLLVLGIVRRRRTAADAAEADDDRGDGDADRRDEGGMPAAATQPA